MKYLTPAAALLFLLLAALPAHALDKPPSIIHEPVKAAVKGQPLNIRATVRDDNGPARAVNLYCSSSSDSAPFKVTMRDSGAGSFIATIPNNMIQSASQLSYYIEAIDSIEQATETPWYTIQFKTVVGGTPADTGKSVEKRSPWIKPLVIVGGTAAAIGIAVAASDSGSNSSSGGSTQTAGLFAGSATRYFQLAGGSATSELYSVVFNLLESGKLTTYSLHPSTHMESTVTGGTFAMTAAASGDLTGQVNYNGSIAGSKITGTISGDVVTGSGTSGTYSGVFSADKQ